MIGILLILYVVLSVVCIATHLANWLTEPTYINCGIYKIVFDNGDYVCTNGDILAILFLWPLMSGMYVYKLLHKSSESGYINKLNKWLESPVRNK